MNCQARLTLVTLICGLALFATHLEAQCSNGRCYSQSRPSPTYTTQARTNGPQRYYYYSNGRPVYYYRTQPATRSAAPAAVARPATRPAAPAASAQPAAAQPAPAQSTSAQPADSASQPTAAATTVARPVVQNASAQVSKPQAPAYNSVILNMLSRNNTIRQSRGMRPMFLSNRLTAAAQNHANYMARTGSMNHYTNGGPQGRASTYGFRGGVRENIAAGQPSVESVFSTWTASGGHYANMMSHSDVAGFGYAVGSGGQAYWVAVYGNNDGGN